MCRHRPLVPLHRRFDGLPERFQTEAQLSLERPLWVDSGQSASVQSFGAARRTKVSEERTRGPRTMVYGYFCFRLSVAQSRAGVGDVRRGAICPNCRWIGSHFRVEIIGKSGLEASLTRDDANSHVGRNGSAADGGGGRPCWSRRFSPGWCIAMRRRPELAPTCECLDDDHVSAAAWARRTSIERLFRHVVIGRRRDGE